MVRIGELLVDPSRRAVTVRERPITLTQKEYALLLALVREPTSVRTKQELLRSVWGYRASGVTRTIDSHACRLRQKLGVYGDEFVVNVWGVGYRLVDADSPVEDELVTEETTPSADEEAAAGDAEDDERGTAADGAGDPVGATAPAGAGTHDEAATARPPLLPAMPPATGPARSAGPASGPTLLLGPGPGEGRS